MMTGDVVLTLLNGVILWVGASCLAIHQGLIAPDMPNYPTAPARTRAAMFVFTVFLFYRSAEIVSGSRVWEMVTGQPFAPPIISTPGQFGATVALTTYLVFQLETVLHQWLPARTWTRIRHLLAVASCGRSEDIAEARRRSNEARNRPETTRDRLPPLTARTRVVGAALAELTLEGATVWGPNEPPTAPMEGKSK
jgi:hypothetical protein